ncbi:ATP-binding protein [Caulobacter sp. Root1472]|uniref:hybrid sensor histidine kinase/response regulator n=1 Tax=Caulobacter sp. Root1472 TaxID=1736470 RepID=UPI0006F2270A|nr:ATP-binding protein [Caulobacter sp. Root1472]KQZ21682.1 hypothetical protein ASD47_25095 [Caulobacter sp. Root1472]
MARPFALQTNTSIGRDVRGLLGTACLLLALVVAAFVIVLALAARAVNEGQVRQEQVLAQKMLERTSAKASNDLTSATIWDQAYNTLRPGGDRAWADAEIGEFFIYNRGVDLAYAVDGDDQPFYGYTADGNIPPEALADFGQVTAPMLAAVRLANAKQLRVLRANIGPAAPQQAQTLTGAVVWRGAVYFVAASTVIPEHASAVRRVGRTCVLFTAVRADTTLVKAVREDLRLKNARLVGPDNAAARLLLKDHAGRPIAGLAWTPARPGLTAMRDAAVIIAGVIVVLLVSVAALTVRIRGIVRRVDRNAADLDAARAEAEAASRSKSLFLANMSHEIRTPLNGVLGMLQVVEREGLPPQQGQRIAIARQSGQSLMVLLNDLLDLSKIEAGRLTLEIRDFDLEHALTLTCRAFEGLAEQKGLKLQLDFGPTLCGFWRGDEVRLRQILGNLISNAIKFTAAGTVAVAARAADGGVEVSVTDTGVGLSSDSLDHVFESFVQGDASTTRLYGGTGLGLAISQRLARAMGGHLSATSALGQGSCFSLSAPLERGSEPLGAAQQPDDGPCLSGGKVLAVDDNRTNRTIIQALLEPLGLEVTLACDGAEAVAMFEQERFDLVLMDIQMPGVDGLAATRSIRRLEERDARTPTPILALTANVMGHQVESYRAAGMDGHIAKPFDAAGLIRSIGRALHPEQNAEA